MFDEIEQIKTDLHSKDTVAKSKACRKLIEMRRDAAWAIPTLIQLIGSESAAVADIASVALYKIGQEAVPLLIKALPECSANQKIYVIHTLQKLHGSSKEIYHVIARYFEDSDHDVILQAAHSIAGIAYDNYEKGIDIRDCVFEKAVTILKKEGETSHNSSWILLKDLRKLGLI
jgi:hypothetical protein